MPGSDPLTMFAMCKGIYGTKWLLMILSRNFIGFPCWEVLSLKGSEGKTVNPRTCSAYLAIGV